MNTTATRATNTTATRRNRRQATRTDRLFVEWLPLADSIARGFAAKGRHLIESDDARQVARAALWLACGRMEDPITAGAYLSRHIRGALLHHARDYGRAIRVPRSAQERGDHGIPWRLLSLETPAGDSGTIGDTIAARPAEPLEPGEQILALLDQLPAEQAAALRLGYIDGLSLRQAGERLGCHGMTVKRNQARGIERLRALAG